MAELIAAKQRRLEMSGVFVTDQFAAVVANGEH